MEDSYTGLPTSHLLGSVPGGTRINEPVKISFARSNNLVELIPAALQAVVDDGKSSTNYEVPEANMQTFPPNNGGDRGRGYQSLAGPSETFEQQPSSNWRGVFSISSYTQYFNVDTDVVLNRLLGSLFPTGGDFSSKIDANPDLYGPIWISTTLIFVIAALGNCATYLMEKKSDTSTSWSFDVGYVNLAVWSIYGYAILVPLGFYFLLHYLGSNASLIRFWCMWGYSLFIFIPSSLLLLIPVEALRWIIILLVGGASACFVGLNLRSYMAGSDLTIIVVAAFLLQMALAIFFKVWFFP